METVDIFAEIYRWNMDDVLGLTRREATCLLKIYEARKEREKASMPKAPRGRRR